MTVTLPKVQVLTAALCASIFLGVIYVQSRNVLAGARDGEEYVYHWSFQIIARLVAFGPFVVAGIALLLFTEWAIARLIVRRLRT